MSIQRIANRRSRRAARSCRSRKQTRAVRALLAAGAAASILVGAQNGFSQSRSEETKIGLQYSFYKDWQAGMNDRMLVHAPQFLVQSPIGEASEIEVGFVFDSVSGASPLYHDTLSGASGLGIKDERLAADIKGTTYFESFSMGVGANTSHEDDYDSDGASIESRIWNDDKSRTFSLGISGHYDQVGSTNNPDLSEYNHNLSEFIGVTQVINKHSLLQSNLTFSASDGFLTDPYKLYDNRPSSREQWAWLLRHVWYIPGWEASLHTDYRYYWDTWSIKGHTLDLQLYQPLSDTWIIRPALRLYSQSKAQFFENEYPPIEENSFYTTDQRLSGFGGITVGAKVIHDFGSGLTANFSTDFYQQRSEWRVFGPGSPNFDPFYAFFLSFGIEKRFK